MTKGVKCNKLFALKCFLFEVSVETYKYKNGPCNRNDEIIPVDNKEDTAKKFTVNAQKPVATPKYKSQKINILSWSSFDFFCRSNIIKKKALKEPIKIRFVIDLSFTT